MAAARRLGLALSALLGMGHFGDCGHAVVGASSTASTQVDGAAVVTVVVDVEAPSCAPIEGAVFLQTDLGVDVATLACEGGCRWSQNFEITDGYRGSVDVEATVECGDCDPDAILVFVRISH